MISTRAFTGVLRFSRSPDKDSTRSASGSRRCRSAGNRDASARMAEALPADAVIHSIFAAAIGHADEIDDHLAGAQALRHAAEVGVVGPDHDGLRVIENLVDIVDHQL